MLGEAVTLVFSVSNKAGFRCAGVNTACPVVQINKKRCLLTHTTLFLLLCMNSGEYQENQIKVMSRMSLFTHAASIRGLSEHEGSAGPAIIVV